MLYDPSKSQELDTDCVTWQNFRKCFLKLKMK